MLPNLFDSEELDVEDESGAGRDDARVTALAVSVVGAASQLCLGSNRHPRNTLIPAFDDLAGSDFELERLSAVTRRIELLAVGQSSSVMNLNSLAMLGESGFIALLDNFNFNTHD